jgi:predicted MFS family arabinose efflux permease
MVYTYLGAVLGRVTGGDGRILAGLLLVWGVAATVGNSLAGRLVDRFDNRGIINAGLCLGIINFCALPWTSAYIATALIALTLWGLVGWGLLVPQQHRLVKLAPQTAPLLLALNNTATYGGLACSGALGGLALLFIDPRYLSIVGAGLIAVALVLAEAAHRCTERKRLRDDATADPYVEAI